MKFTECNLHPHIVDALKKIGFENATEVQQKTIPQVLKNRDIVVRSQTGSGKTFAYILPLIQNIDYNSDGVQALIVCPTRELTMQVNDEIKKLKSSLKQLKAVPIYGGSDISRQISALKQRPQIIVGTPGRLIDHLKRHTLKLHSLKTVVLDEADEMLNMGFKEDIEKILIDTPKTRQTLMFSATFPKEILELTTNYQNNPVKIEVGEDNRSLKNISQSYVLVNKTQKLEAIQAIFEKVQPNKSIIFTNTKIMAQKLSDHLNKIGLHSLALHGDLRQGTRKKVISDIKTNAIDILVASDVAARGIDIAEVDYVINYDLPNNVEYFLHRIGRTARAGKSGNAITILNSKNQLKELQQYEKLTHSEIVELALDIVVKPESSTKTTSSSELKNKRISNTERFSPQNRDRKTSKSSSDRRGFEGRKTYKTNTDKLGAEGRNFSKTDSAKQGYERRQSSKFDSAKQGYEGRKSVKKDAPRINSIDRKTSKSSSEKRGFEGRTFSKTDSAKQGYERRQSSKFDSAKQGYEGRKSVRKDAPRSNSIDRKTSKPTQTRDFETNNYEGKNSYKSNYDKRDFQDKKDGVKSRKQNSNRNENYQANKVIDDNKTTRNFKHKKTQETQTKNSFKTKSNSRDKKFSNKIEKNQVKKFSQSPRAKKPIQRKLKNK